MGKAKVEVTFKFPDLLRAFERSYDRIERTIASTIQTQLGMRFDAEGAHNGHPKWAPLKMRDGQILSMTGTLRKSISPPQADGKPGDQGFVRSSGLPDDMLVEVGTKVIYASTHDNGAIIRPVNKKALRFFGSDGKTPIFAKKSVIPQRQFTDLNEKDRQEIEETLTGLVKDILENAT
jgi:phage gpG-like protein